MRLAGVGRKAKHPGRGGRPHRTGARRPCTGARPVVTVPVWRASAERRTAKKAPTVQAALDTYGRRLVSAKEVGHAGKRKGLAKKALLCAA